MADGGPRLLAAQTGIADLAQLDVLEGVLLREIPPVTLFDRSELQLAEFHQQGADLLPGDAPSEDDPLQLGPGEQADEGLGEHAVARNFEALAVGQQRPLSLRQVELVVLFEDNVDGIVNVAQRIGDRPALRRIELDIAHGRHEGAEHVWDPRHAIGG